MIVLPAIDLRGGRCVRLRQGDPGRERVFAADPVAMARRWADAGAPFLHVVDLDGAFAGRPEQLDLVAAIAAAVEAPVELGGGLRTAADVDAALETGIERAVIGTSALADPGFARDMAERHGDRICVGIDARAGRVAVRGWAETTDRLATDLARDCAAAGVRRVIVTDIATDGMLTGPNLAGLGEVCDAFPGAVIASGGIATAADLHAVGAIGDGRIEGTIVGRALYEETLRLAEVPEFLRPGTGEPGCPDA